MALTRTTRYLDRQGNLYGGAASVPARVTEVVAARGLPCAGPLQAGGRLALPFTLAVPTEGPGSVAASLIQVQWAVRVRMHVSGSPPTVSSHPIVVLSRASDRIAVAEEPPATVDRGSWHFASRPCRPGGSSRPDPRSQGMLALDPLRPGSARGLRIELARA